MITYSHKIGSLSVVDTTRVTSKSVGIPAGLSIDSLVFYFRVNADPRDAEAIRKWRRMAEGYESAIIQVSRGAAINEDAPLVSPPNGYPLYGETIIDPWYGQTNKGWQPLGAGWWTMNGDDPSPLATPEDYWFNLWVTKGLYGIRIVTVAEWSVTT